MSVNGNDTTYQFSTFYSKKGSAFIRSLSGECNDVKNIFWGEKENRKKWQALKDLVRNKELQLSHANFENKVRFYETKLTTTYLQD